MAHIPPRPKFHSKVPTRLSRPTYLAEENQYVAMLPSSAATISRCRLHCVAWPSMLTSHQLFKIHHHAASSQIVCTCGRSDYVGGLHRSKAEPLVRSPAPDIVICMAVLLFACSSSAMRFAALLFPKQRYFASIYQLTPDLFLSKLDVLQGNHSPALISDVYFTLYFGFIAAHLHLLCSI